MTVLQILALTGVAILLSFLRRGRSLALVTVSALVIYWLQPAIKVYPTLSFWLPTFTLFLVALTWVITAPRESRNLRDNWPALAVLTSVILFVVFSDVQPWLKFPSAGSIRFVAIGLAGFLGLTFVLSLLKKDNRLLLIVTALGLLAIFVFLKSPSVSEWTLNLLADLRGGVSDTAIPSSIAWLGYSYVAFRLLHTIRDRQSGVLPAVGLAEYLNYVIFFPASTAGPIDRLERFVTELREPLPLKNDDWLFAGQRLALGLFKKFFLADTLALISIKDALVGQTISGGWLWVTLFAYSFRVYFDFSGYTDIAIGIGRLLGIRLPENFTAPFLKPNLTQFWNSWHITLTQWFRSYFFNPVTRFLRSRKRPLPFTLILLLTQTTTMLLIGLWHGITWNFALWGLWHGLGLFIQNRWTEFTRRLFPDFVPAPVPRGIFQALGVALTFIYFSLGIVFFALSTPQLSVQALLKLFGFA
ncbi:MAG: MBOAT family protein [Anaerolineaceae bacterium]|nr:MAG: MBOAT family protein [Anaerolineaceae bacterium]